MYRDDLEALRARLTTVEAELRAAKQHRTAAEAKMQAALASADEEKVRARLAGEDTKVTRIPGYWQNGRTLVLIGSLAGLMLALGYFIYIASSEPEEAEQSSTMTRQLEQARKQIEELKRITQSQGLEMRRLSAKLQRSTDDRDRPGFEAVDPIQEPKHKLIQAAQNAYVAGNHRRATRLCQQLLKLHPDHYKAIQIMGASSCYLRDLRQAQWSYDRVKPHYRALLKKVCLNNGLQLEDR